MTDSAADADSRTLRSTLRSTTFTSLPWITVGVAFVAMNHTADTQTLVTAVAKRLPDALENVERMWLIPPAACAAGLATAVTKTLPVRLVTAMAATIFVTVLAGINPALLYTALFVNLACMGAHAWLTVKNASPWRPGIFAASILTFILAYAALKRQDMLFRFINTKPDPDFETYLSLAQKASGWATAFREPLYVWLLQFIDGIGSDLNPVMLRLTGVAGGLAAVAAIFHMCRLHLNLVVATIAALLYSGQEYIVYTSVRGLREDWIVCLTILFISMGWTHLSRPVTSRSLTAWGAVSAASTAMRISNLSFVFLMIPLTAAYRFIRDIKPWRQRLLWVIPLAMTAALIAPWLAHNKQEYGDPFFVINRAARFFANEEFGGTPGFPTRAELAVHAYAGPKITPREYMFNYHSTGEVIRRTWDGFTKTFFGHNFKVGYNLIKDPDLTGLLYVLHFIGLGLMLFPHRIYLVIAMVLFHSSTFFLASIPTFDPRLLIVAMVFSYITVASAVGLSLGYTYDYMRSDLDDTGIKVKRHKNTPNRLKEAKPASTGSSRAKKSSKKSERIRA